MRDRLRMGLAVGWALLVLSGVIGMIWNVMAGATAAERGDRAQISSAVLAAVLIVPPVLVWTRHTLIRSRTLQVVTPEQRASAAEHLAAKALMSWGEQARRQGITTTAPVAVRWRVGPADLAPAVLDLRPDVQPARRSPGSAPGIPAPGGLWLPITPSGHSVPSLTQGVVTAWYDDLYTRLGTDVLVVLGAPGSGKSGAMLLLLLEALRRRRDLPAEGRARTPVPVWVTCGSWDPSATTLPDHVAAVLARDYPSLTSTDHGGKPGPAALIEHAQVAVFLDGLDEMPPGLQAAALSAITVQGASLPIVLTSRTTEYRTATRSGGFRPAAVIELCPVDPTAAADFLTAREPADRAAVWQPVLTHMLTHPESPLSQVLATPLGLALARDTYTNHDPAALLHPDQATRHLVLTSLLGAFLEHAYPARQEREHAVIWLSWIAHQMSTTTAGPTRDLRWWDIPTWIPTWQRRLTAALTAALTPIFGIFLLTLPIVLVSMLMDGWSRWRMEEMAYGLVAGLAIGLPSGTVVAIVIGRVGAPQTLRLRLPQVRELPTILKSGIQTGSAYGLILGLTTVLMVALAGNDLREVLTDGLIVALVFGVPAGLIAGPFRLWRTPADDSPVATPTGSYRADHRTGLTYGWVAGLTVGLVVGLTYGLPVGMTEGLADALISGLEFGLVAGLMAMFVIKLTSGPAPQVRITQVALSIRRRGRVRFIPLLEDALNRQVLRQVGAVYQFRHAELHDYLAVAETTQSG